MTIVSRIGLAAGALALALALTTPQARADGVSESPSWRLEQVLPPQQPGESNEQHDQRFPVGLGKVGDIEFWAPNRGLLITAGSPPTIPGGVWGYNGREWRELATVCGATDGRIAWAGPDDFWTVSDGRPGQAANEGIKPPLEDNTLCHFDAEGGRPLQVVGSYASLAFQADSYQAMDGAACLGPSDCWFGGELFPEVQPGVRSEFGGFQLHWNGSSVAEENYPAEHAIEDMRRYGRYLYESVQLSQADKLLESESRSAPPDLHLITLIGVQPTFISLSPGVPRYAPGPAPNEERPYALGFLHLSSDEEALWGAADPVRKPSESAPGEVTILRYSETEDKWNQVLGYGSDPPEGNPFTQPERSEEQNETVNSIAAEPGTPDAWLALTSPDNTQAERSDAAEAMVARVSDEGKVSERETLPSAGEGLTAKGAAERIVCPASNDCWLVTSRGWLFHYSDEADRQLPENGDPAFSQLVTFRPPDAGIPQVVPDAPPLDDSGLLGEPPPTYGSPVETKAAPTTELKVPAALMSDIHTHEHGTTLELSFRLVVKARVRLIADRGKKRVASTPMRTLAAGSHKLVLHLNRREWPTKLSLESHPLAPLPTTTVKQAVGGPEHGGNGSTSVSTGVAVLPDVSWLAKSELRP